MQSEVVVSLLDPVQRALPGPGPGPIVVELERWPRPLLSVHLSFAAHAGTCPGTDIASSSMNNGLTAFPGPVPRSSVRPSGRCGRTFAYVNEVNDFLRVHAVPECTMRHRDRPPAGWPAGRTGDVALPTDSRHALSRRYLLGDL